jgi:short-subunit dehydrogenase
VRRLAHQHGERLRIALLARGMGGLDAARHEVESTGGKAITLPADVADAAQVEAAAQKTEQEFGPIDLWINNAMVSMYSPFWEISPEEYKHITEVTYLGQVYGTMSALKRMMPRDRGTIVQVGSALAHRSIPLQSAYCGAKHAVAGFTESIRAELIHQNSNVQITIVDLPGVNTPQFEWTLNRMPNEPRPTGPIYEPEVAAEAIVFAAEHPQRKRLLVGMPTVESTIGEKFVPGLLDHYLAHAAWEGAQTSTRADHHKPNNFWKPLPGDFGARGKFTAQARGHSVQLWVTKNRRLLTALAAAGVAALAAASASRSWQHKS